MLRLSVSHRIIRIASCKIHQKPIYMGSNYQSQISDKVICKTNRRLYSGMIDSAFASLKVNEKLPDDKMIDKVIGQAKTIDDLLNIPEKLLLKENDALKIISLLNSWVAEKKVCFQDFNKDSRFLKICSVFNEHNNKLAEDKLNYKNDLVTVLNYSGDDEAAKLISKISLPQMIKIMQALVNSKRRSKTLLQSLAFNICLSKEVLNYKQCSDVLFCMAKLNYQNELLIQRISNELYDSNSKSIDRTAVIGSILGSLGILRFFDMDLLDFLADLLLKNIDKCRNQELVSLIKTLGSFNYLPTNSESLFKTILPKLSLLEMNSQRTWIEVVWSLVVLEYANKEIVESVLNPEFLKKISLDELSSTHKLKLLNINAAAKYLMKNYDGPFLDIKKMQVDISYSKEKNTFCDLVIESLTNFLPAPEFLKTTVTTDMGFKIDAECMFDAKLKPVKYSKNKGKNNTKVGFLIAYYHDVCSNDTSKILGTKVLAKRILEELNYKIVIIPYSNFHSSSKLTDRLEYIDTKIKDCIK